ncbi:HAD family hydrolase [Anaerococcus murdochii]|uniref:HAD family hydrolase n=1 Tax=Anaerococcus murdochii TaxID=411577 RepID=UPI0032B4B6C7
MKEYIKKGSWNDRAFQFLNKLIADHGRDNPAYNPEKKPFAVFDWDNTSIIGDVEEAAFYYLVTNLAFKINPEDLYHIIRKNVDKGDFKDPYKNLDGNSVNIDQISADIYDVYKRLYGTSDRLGGDVPFNLIKETNAYKEFVAKMFFRYKAAEYDKDARDPYCWMTFLFTNYDQNEIEEFCDKAFKFVKKEEARREIFTSPEIESQAGRISVSYFVGMGDIPEMADLFHTLEREGIDVYVVSASFIDIVRAFATKNSYKFDGEKVLGLRLAKDDEGKVIPELDHSYPLTQKSGKSETIKKLIQNETNYGPILVGGDSDGDYAMLTDFEETDLGIIIDRQRHGDINKLKDEALAGSSAYILQARDQYGKKFIREERSI